MVSKKILSLILLLSLSGCAFGTSKLKVDFPNDLQMVSDIQNQVSETSTFQPAPDINIKAKWIGNAYPVSTSKSIFGMTNRYVIPYTKLTSLIQLEIDNNSDKFVEFTIKDIKLKSDQSKDELSPLTIDFFKSRWPTFAVKTQEMLIDQSIAIGDVIRTIATDRLIEPKSDYKGYLAFSRLPESTQNIEISGVLKVDNKDSNILIRFRKK